MSQIGLNEPMIQRTFGGGSLGGKQISLEAPGFTPWFDVWMKFMINSFPTGTADHEFIRHHLGCIFVISSSTKNPVEQLQVLSQQQYRHQHEKGVSTSNVGGVYPQYLCTNILKYYVVIHDAFEVDDASAQEMFIKVQNAFGSTSCHLLRINSRTGQLIQSTNKEIESSQDCDTKTGNPGVADFWINHIDGYRFCNVETRFAYIVGETSSNKISTPKIKANNCHDSSNDSTSHNANKVNDITMNSHPLANNDLSNDSTDFVDVSEIVKKVADGSKASSTMPALIPVTAANTALLLNSNDIDRIRAFIKEFVIKGLIPYLEKQMRTLQEIVTNRKSRSLFSGAKKWFSGAAASAGNKTGAGSLLGSTAGSGMTGGGTSVIYAREAPELQMRRLGDIYFMLKLYKLAYSSYHTAKRDFQSDEVWNYYAGAAEMAALSQFMQGITNQSDNSKISGTLAVGAGSSSVPTKYPAHYMEDAITKYLSVCTMPEFALRATLFDALCFKHQAMFQEAAVSFIRMTNEGKDLRSALLLEQAAYCYLLGSSPLIRKYAFHIILAGYRFSKSGQKFHSSRVYRQGFQIYKGQGWSLSEDHILYSLGHQSLLLKDHYTAANLFNELLSNTNARHNLVGNKLLSSTFGGASRLQINSNPLQQMCHLREFFIVHHMREKEDKKVASITIPTFLAQECILDISGKSMINDSTSKSACNASYNMCSSSYDVLKKVSGESFIDTKLPPRLELERVIEERISGQESFLSQTCQTIFGPDSDNTLPPQGVVGEKIRLIIPAKNVFQTPLLLKKVSLIWKFDEAGGNDDKTIQSDKTSLADAEKAVITDIVDSVLMPSDETVLIDAGITPQKSGSVTILGLQYSIKAQFPQSESTDYTIQGKQYLKVHGPRLMQTQDQRTNKDPVYSKDVRMGHPIDIIDCDNRALPNLGFHIDNWPSSIHQGEIRKVSLSISNISMSQCASIDRVYLVSNQPGTFTTDNNIHKSLSSENTKLGELPFEFPVIRDPSLSVTKDGHTNDLLIDIIPIDIEIDVSKRKSDKSLDVPLWICGPSKLGNNKLTVYFYYENNTETKKAFGKRRPLQYRMIRVDLSLVVLPSLSISAIRSPACVHENDLSQAILVKIQRSSSGNQSISLHSIRIREISLISRLNNSLCEMISSKENQITIMDGDSTTFCLKSAYEFEKTDSDKYVNYTDTENSIARKICISRIKVDENNIKGHDISTSCSKSTPHIDFIKNCFSYTEASKVTSSKNIVDLHNELILVSWQAENENSQFYGQVHVPVEVEGGKELSNDLEDTVDSSIPKNQGGNMTSNTYSMASDNESVDQISTLPTPNYPCKIGLSVR